MKTTLKLFLLLTFFLAALCSMREFSYQINGLAISIPKNNAAPFFKIVQNNTLYYAKFQSIYEIYQRNDTLQWFKLPDTEVKLNSLNWNSTLDWDNDTISLFGAPCPCLDNIEQQDTYLDKRHHLDNNKKEDCPVVNFDYLRFGIQRNSLNCVIPDLSSCAATCTSNCENSENNTACLAGCNAITDISFLDSQICDTACANDTICWNSCYALFDCLINNSCSLKVNYHLNRYQWSNISDLGENVTRKLVFSFKIVPQYDQQQCCGTQFDFWVRGNYSLFFNATTLSINANANTNGSNNGGNNTIDADQCNNTCASACEGAANVSNCVAFCNSFYNVTSLDETICNATCIINETLVTDCLVACNSWTVCLNSSNNGTTGNNTVDLDAPVEIPSTFVWALRGEAIFVRAYFDNLQNGYSLYNLYPVVQNTTVPPSNETNNDTNTPQARRRALKFGYDLQ